jgi:hypothetical protein
MIKYNLVNSFFFFLLQSKIYQQEISISHITNKNLRDLDMGMDPTNLHQEAQVAIE